MKSEAVHVRSTLFQDLGAEIWVDVTDTQNAIYDYVRMNVSFMD